MTQMSQRVSAWQIFEAMDATAYGKLESLLYFSRQSCLNQHYIKEFRKPSAGDNERNT